MLWYRPGMPTVLLTPAEVSKRIHISEYTLRMWRRADRGPPFIVVGERTPRYPEEKLERWIEARTKGDDVPAVVQGDEVA